MIKIIGHLNEPKINGQEIDKETQINMIWNSLIDIFDHFCLDLDLNQNEWSLTCLL